MDLKNVVCSYCSEKWNGKKTFGFKALEEHTKHKHFKGIPARTILLKGCTKCWNYFPAGSIFKSHVKECGKKV